MNEHASKITVIIIVVCAYIALNQVAIIIRESYSLKINGNLRLDIVQILISNVHYNFPSPFKTLSTKLLWTSTRTTAILASIVGKHGDPWHLCWLKHDPTSDGWLDYIIIITMHMQTPFTALSIPLHWIHLLADHDSSPEEQHCWYVLVTNHTDPWQFTKL